MPADLIKWGTLSSGIAAVVTIIILASQTATLSSGVAQQVIQTKILQSQFEEKDRPWIGIDKNLNFGNDTIGFDFTNYGTVPSTGG